MKPTNIYLENVFAPYKAQKLTEADVSDILDLYLENTEYFKHCPPSPNRETVKEDMVAFPPKKEAVKCFNTAAEKYNSGVAYHNLGICYENGFGVRKNYRKAIETYGKAVENGEKAGLEAIKNVYAKMTAEKKSV